MPLASLPTRAETRSMQWSLPARWQSVAHVTRFQEDSMHRVCQRRIQPLVGLERLMPRWGLLISWLLFGMSFSVLCQPGHAQDSASQMAFSLNDAAGLKQVEGPQGRMAVRMERDTAPVIRDGSAFPDGRGSFSIATWVNVPEAGHESPGDLLSAEASDGSTLWHLGIRTHAGVTNAQSNRRQLSFALQDSSGPLEFQDHGRPGNAVYIFSLCVYRSRLYAATCEPGAGEAGHVYRLENNNWVDLGSPDRANAISSLAVFNGSLYAASSKYRLAGSSLAESENVNPGGSVFRLTDNDTWESCGRVSGETEAIASLVDFRGRLYASSLYKPAGFFVLGNNHTWEALPVPDGKRVEAMTVFDDAIYATSYDEGSVFRFDGAQWTHVTSIPNATQTYGFGIHRNRLFVSEWPQAHVYRLDDPTKNVWSDTGRLGNELEAMPLLTAGNHLYCGSLPGAQVFRFDGDQHWTLIGQVDHTPDVRYRRAWSMAVFQGRLFVGTLPSGKVLSASTGPCVTWDEEFPTGWHHVAAVRSESELRLYLDGREVAKRSVSSADRGHLPEVARLVFGSGPQKNFRGEVAGLNVYRSELSEADILKDMNSMP